MGGMQDLSERRVRLIGDPVTRYREDPVRMLRAVRFASKLDFTIDESAAEPIPALTGLLADVPPARLFDEVLKLFLSEKAESNFDGLMHFGLFDVLFPEVARAMHEDQSGRVEALIRLALRSTAQRIADDKPVTPAFVFAAMLWAPAQAAAAALREQGVPPSPALAQGASEVIGQQCRTVAIPRRFSGMQGDIWQLQVRFEFRRGKRPFRLLENKRFRAAYDFLALRAQAGEVDQELVDWWTQFQDVSHEERKQMSEAAPGGPGGAGSGRRRRRRKRR